jgi:16S rRNA (cytosine1402-N4)-methyltransferase
MYRHIPVLLQQAITLLDPKPNQNFIDATLGGGGYSKALLEKILPDGKVLSIDLDTEAIENFHNDIRREKYSHNAVVAHGNFSQIDRIVEHKEFSDIDGIVADIGLSSYQLDESGRGITFQKREPLDMRFDLSSKEPDARFMLNEYAEEQLNHIFATYGEERESKRIARAVSTARAKENIHYTTDLIEIIKSALPKPVQHKWKDNARRVFQALRIAVNHELENLEELLPKALDLVKPAGKIVIVSFHSLEDRIVKEFFVNAARGCICPKEFPICKCGQTPRAKLLTKKPISADEFEAAENSRSIPAKLRAIEKIK